MTDPTPSPVRSNWDLAPVWFKWALHELGIREVPGRGSNPRIIEYRRIAKIEIAGDDSDVPWCAIFANAALEANGIAGTRSAAARSFAHSDAMVPLAGPALGALAVFWRGGPAGGLGHVGFYRGETASHVYTLGGNEGDAVSIVPLAKWAPHFGLVGYFWPKRGPAPDIAPVLINAGAPLNPVSVV